MNILSHPVSALSMRVSMNKSMRAFAMRSGAIAVALMALVGSDIALANPSSTSVHYGRWTVDDPGARFSARGRDYKTIDIAPCGKDFCGVSVNDQGRCGPVLFRFLAKNRNADNLKGHGRWGNAKKKLGINTYRLITNDRAFHLTLGDGYEYVERSGNMPTYESGYRRTGAARCTAR
ncbi:hypothetical protein [Pseudonocardia sp. TMWB2A]|uniref:hypothetical protein n=1 Tax=Pseudonocardia sp. TMWB2A TaxID=687430 RepID=UPI00307EC585